MGGTPGDIPDSLEFLRFSSSPLLNWDCVDGSFVKVVRSQIFADLFLRVIPFLYRFRGTVPLLESVGVFFFIPPEERSPVFLEGVLGKQ